MVTAQAAQAACEPLMSCLVISCSAQLKMLLSSAREQLLSRAVTALLIAIVKSMQLVNLIAQNALNF
jgi:hypothetical protein